MQPRPRRAPSLPHSPASRNAFGTRWVVWIGGLALALGGFFMVRYSIEAGLLGPGVRVLLGGLFALGLLGAGEWTRRKEEISSIQALPIANIPAILTAAGTARRVRNRSMRPMRSTASWCRPRPSCCSASSRSARSPRHCCTGRRSPASAWSAPSSTPIAGLLASKPDYLGALRLSRDRHRRELRPRPDPAVALARRDHNRLRAAVDHARP